MSLQNLGFYIDKLYFINKELGGRAKEGTILSLTIFKIQ